MLFQKYARFLGGRCGWYGVIFEYDHVANDVKDPMFASDGANFVVVF